MYFDLPIIVYEVIAGISYMDIELVEFLLKEPEYNGQTKADFLRDLDGVFEQLKKAGDTRLEVYKGRCMKEESERLAVTFIGKTSRDYFHLVFDLNEEHLQDIQCEKVLGPTQVHQVRKQLVLNDSHTAFLSERPPLKRAKSAKTLPKRHDYETTFYNAIYPHYFQKSTVFLYPLVQIPGFPCVKPLRTFLTDGDKVPLEEPSLLVLYKQEDTEHWRQFEYHSLENSYELKQMQELDNKMLLCTFDLSYNKADYRLFLQGLYSDFSRRAKTIILRHFIYEDPAMAHICSYLYPESFYALYAKILAMDEAQLRSSVELCTSYDLARETLDLTQALPPIHEGMGTWDGKEYEDRSTWFD